MGGQVLFDVVAIVILAGAICAIALQLLDGKGPSVYYIPTSLRPRVNRFYVRHGWPAPFDADMNLIPRKDR